MRVRVRVGGYPQAFHIPAAPQGVNYVRDVSAVLARRARSSRAPTELSRV